MNIMNFKLQLTKLDLLCFSLFVFELLSGFKFQFGIAYSGVHVTVEALIKDKELVSTIKDLVSGSGRSHPGGQAERQASHKSAVATTEKQQIASSKDKVHLATPLNSVAHETLAVR